MNPHSKFLKTLSDGQRPIMEHHMLWQTQPRYAVELANSPAIGNLSVLFDLYQELERKGYLQRVNETRNFRDTDDQLHVMSKYVLGTIPSNMQRAGQQESSW